MEKCDKSSMLELIESFPDQCQDAARIGYELEIPEGFKSGYKTIVCAGMGGSAIGADLVRSYIADDAAIPIFINRSYTLPNFVCEDTLVVVSSYSGQTEETLSAYNEARSRGCEIVVITSGGKLRKMAEEDNFLCINVPAGFPPRAALGYSFFPLLILFSKIGVIKDQSVPINDAIRTLRKLRSTKIGYKVAQKYNPAKKIACELRGAIPVVYASADHMDSVVTRWRGQFAENSKTLASGHLFPEMNHNEIVGWRNPGALLKKFVVIMLRDEADHPRVSKRMDVTKGIFKKYGIRTIEVSSSGKDLLARIFSLIYIGDFISFYLAILNGVDPTPVDVITYLKKELART